MHRRNEQKTMEVKEEMMLNETGGREGNESEGEGKGELVRRQKRRTKREKKKTKEEWPCLTYLFFLSSFFVTLHFWFLLMPVSHGPLASSNLALSRCPSNIWHNNGFFKSAPFVYTERGGCDIAMNCPIVILFPSISVSICASHKLAIYDNDHRKMRLIQMWKKHEKVAQDFKLRGSATNEFGV